MKRITRTTAARAVAGAAVAAVLAAGLGAPAGAEPPPPAVALPDTTPNTLAVFGENADGAVFYNRSTMDPQGAVRLADGTVVQLTKTLSGRGDIGPDGRLWLPLGGSLWAFGADGSATEYPITVADVTTTTGLNEVRAGVDGRIWFTDTLRSRVGSIATDGTAATVVPLVGERGLEHLTPGPDGRMWVTRSTGVLYAVTTAGAVTTYPSIGKPVAGLASNPSGIYATVGNTLKRISSAGVATVPSLPVASSVVGAPVASDGWVWLDAATVISPSGRISQFAMPVDYDLSNLGGSGLIAYPDRVAVAPSAAGGFVGVVGASLVRIPNPDVGVNLAVSTRVSLTKGVNVLHIRATARTPGGAAHSGTFEVRMGWNRYIPDGFLYYQRASRKIATVTITNGVGTVDVPITPALLAGTPKPYTLDHGNCCTVALRSSTGLTSVAADTSIADVGPSSTSAWLDRMNARALGRSMDTAGLVYWSGKLASGTPRATVTKSIVDSTAWRRQRVTSAYQRWLNRAPDAAGLEYWQNWLKTHTTSDLDFQLGMSVAGRDAGGTTSAQRGKHLASALRLSSASAESFAQQLAAGSSWSGLVRSAYFGRSAAERRMSDLAPRSSFTPSVAAQVDEFRTTRDERGPLVKALATMP